MRLHLLALILRGQPAREFLNSCDGRASDRPASREGLRHRRATIQAGLDPKQGKRDEDPEHRQDDTEGVNEDCQRGVTI